MKRIALIGMPNTGKSMLFNRLTGATTRVGNWPGITVDLISARILIGAQMVELIDLPGLYDIQGSSNDEKVVRHFLENQRLDLAVVVVNACQLERQLPLFFQVKHLGIPCVLLLNMADDARRFGIDIDIAKLSALLDTPVFLISATSAKQQTVALQGIDRALQRAKPALSSSIHAALLQETRNGIHCEDIVKQTVTIPAILPAQMSDRIDHWLLHPIVGLPFFFLMMFIAFNGLFWLGKPLQATMDWLFSFLKGLIAASVEPVLPSFFYHLLLDGVWNGIATVATFLPVIVLFFFFMAIIEDTGYLSRAAFLTDAFMSRLGLDGTSLVMFLFGFGCNVPAVMATRTIRSQSMRFLSMLIIPFSLCSARLQVFLFLIIALFSPQQAPWVLTLLYITSFAAAFATAFFFKSRSRTTEPFIIELPPYRFPLFKQVLVRGWLEVKHFLSRASKIIIAGVTLLWLLTHLPIGVEAASPHSYAGMLGSLFAPLMAPLGIDEKLTIALIFGFVAKEVVISSLVVLYGLGGSPDALPQALAAQIDTVQACSFMLFTLLYTPCLATLATLHSEAKNKRHVITCLIWPLLLAWSISFIFYQSARALGY